MKTYNKDQPLLVFARNWLIQPFKLAGPNIVTALLYFFKKFLSNFTSLETLAFKSVWQYLSGTFYFFFLFFDHIVPVQIVKWPQKWPLPIHTQLMLKKEEIIVAFFSQTLRGHILWMDCPINLIFCMVTSYDLVYWCIKFQECSVCPTTQTSLLNQKFQISVVKKISDDFFLNFAWTTI